MYRRFPKLKGIAGGMGAGRPKFVTVNVGAIEEAVKAKKLDASAEVTLAPAATSTDRDGGQGKMCARHQLVATTCILVNKQ